MRNNSVLFFILTLFFAPMCVWAQNPVFDHPLSDQNIQNFDAVCAQLASRPYTKGVFEQTRIIRRQNRPLVSGGDFIIAADSGLVWITKYPAASITTLGKDYMIQLVPGGTGTKIDAKDNDMYVNMADTLSSLFTGNAQKLKSGFDNYYTESSTTDGKVWIIGLIPKDKIFRNYIQHIILEGFDDGKVMVIRSITMNEKGGGSTVYAFSAQIFPEVLEAHEKAYFSP